MDVRDHNRKAWDQSVAEGNRWTVPVSREEVDRARQGDFKILLTPTRPVPADWFPDLNGTRTLCLAAAGGQQAPLLAAAGSIVTVFDNSPGQLAQDRSVAERDGLSLKLVEGDMADLSEFADGSFDLIVHPCSNAFVPDVNPVWRECFRVLCPGGSLLAGFTNSLRYLFDYERMEQGELEVRNSIPYSDVAHLPAAYLQKMIDAGEALEFGHSLEDQIGGQLRAGFVLAGMFEDRYPEEDEDLLSTYVDTFIATQAVKPERH
ncbi:hypothetical protein Mal4_13150 [Maioricimonas rarisocia]|uniref:Methyltransferase type 11 domain-containing protein n=1 Tax=Maioricimonas rarisocia TaxID=2528026 RepID=A0A517Z3D9_9PLAN|nr:class I SAM-dependent methyltransferase [Maioricimonas rarisocia]QDU37012.1 hypothetical protein Mal4_13150 [Maioricimonas rarisocia]